LIFKNKKKMSSEKTYKSMSVELNRVNDAFHFEAYGSEKVPVHIDAAEAIGGTHAGARPMELLLIGLGGCTAIDVLLILKKGRQIVEDIKIKISGLRDAEANPAPFEKIHLHYIFKGNLKPDKVENAIRLSMEKYCSATAMLEKAAEITWDFKVID
jgi:putative redox protein